MNSDFEYITSLQYRVKALSRKLDDFRSGETYIKMDNSHRMIVRSLNRDITRLKLELSRAHSETVTVRRYWSEILDDLEKEHERELRARERQIGELEDRLFRVLHTIDIQRDMIREKNRELYRVKTELLEEQEKNRKLRAQLNRDHENSSLPSSMKPHHKKITNSREKTEKKPGGQPGHKGHGRKKQEPSDRIFIPPPEIYENSPDYTPTGKMIRKQLICLRTDVICNEYFTPEYRNKRTGVRVHADFPDGIRNDVNYDGSVRAFLYLLNNHCFVSMDKAREFLKDLSGGKLDISKGMVSGLSREFSQKTEADQKKAFADLLLSPAMNADFTGARVNGENVHVAVCASPSSGTSMYFAREKKGHEGIKGTPVHDYQGSLIHDHDKTFYHYGNAHQECLAHIVRYLLDSTLNEPGLNWNLRMRDLIREMIHYRNTLKPGDKPDPDTVKGYEARYHEILQTAGEEYEYEPPGRYYRDGYNLYRRLDEYRESHLLFLHDMTVPATNNLAERLLRVFKRKQRQVMSFRSFDSLTHICNGMGVLASLRASGKNLYDSTSSFFA